MDVVALVVAVVGIVLAAASLVWQFATFVLSGARIKVDLLLGARSHQGFLTSPISSWRGLTQPMLDMGYFESRVFVKVRNTGRAAVNVESVSFRTLDGIAYGTVGAQPWEMRFPHRLQPGASQTWSLDVDGVAATLNAVAAIGKRPVGVALVSLGDGREKASRDRLSSTQLNPYLDLERT